MSRSRPPEFLPPPPYHWAYNPANVNATYEDYAQQGYSDREIDQLCTEGRQDCWFIDWCSWLHQCYDHSGMQGVNWGLSHYESEWLYQFRDYHPDFEPPLPMRTHSRPQDEHTSPQDPSDPPTSHRSGHGQRAHRRSYGGPQPSHAQQPSVNQPGNTYLSPPQPHTAFSRPRGVIRSVVSRSTSGGSKSAQSYSRARSASGRTQDGISGAAPRATSSRATNGPRRSSGAPGSVMNVTTAGAPASAYAASLVPPSRLTHAPTAQSPQQRRDVSSAATIPPDLGDTGVQPSHQLSHSAAVMSSTPTSTTGPSYDQAAFQQQVEDFINEIEQQVRGGRGRSRSPRRDPEHYYRDRENSQHPPLLPRRRRNEPLTQFDQYTGYSDVPRDGHTDPPPSSPSPDRSRGGAHSRSSRHSNTHSNRTAHDSNVVVLTGRAARRYNYREMQRRLRKEHSDRRSDRDGR